MSALTDRFKANLNTKAKKELVKTYDENDTLMQIASWIPVGEWFHEGTGGEGFPCGHITQIIGKTDSGKSTLAMEGMVGCQKAGGVVFLIDSEHKFSLNRFKKMGGVPQDLVIISVESLEEAWNSIHQVCEEVSKLREDGDKSAIMLVWDSVPASIPKKILEEEDAGSAHFALEAKINNKNVRKLRQAIRETELCCVFINHYYMTAPKTMYEQPEKVIKGGEEMGFMSTMISEVKSGKALMRDFKGQKQQIGKVSKIQIIKGHFHGRNMRMEMNNVEIGLLNDEEFTEYQKTLRGKL